MIVGEDRFGVGSLLVFVKIVERHVWKIDFESSEFRDTFELKIPKVVASFAC